MSGLFVRRRHRPRAHGAPGGRGHRRFLLRAPVRSDLRPPRPSGTARPARSPNLPLCGGTGSGKTMLANWVTRTPPLAVVADIKSNQINSLRIPTPACRPRRCRRWCTPGRRGSRLHGRLCGRSGSKGRCGQDLPGPFPDLVVGDTQVRSRMSPARGVWTLTSTRSLAASSPLNFSAETLVYMAGQSAQIPPGMRRST